MKHGPDEKFVTGGPPRDGGTRGQSNVLILLWRELKSFMDAFKEIISEVEGQGLLDLNSKAHRDQKLTHLFLPQWS